jgi:hypothetical protein
MLRLVLKLANQPNGVATGMLTSIDQGGMEIPINAIIETGTHLKLLVLIIAGTYEGDLDQGVLKGRWVQGPLNLPLVFTRSK